DEIGRKAARHHEADATLGSLRKISGKFVDVPEPVFQAGVHGAHQHPVFQFSKTEIEGFQQVGIACGHEALTNNIYPEYTLDQWQVDLTFRTGHVSSVFKFD